MAELTAQREGSGQTSQTPSKPDLPRQFGFFAVLIFGVSCISLSSSGQMPFSVVLGIWPGVNLVAALTVALGASLILAYTYSVIGSIAQRSGADYVVASRTISTSLGFASSFTFTIFSAIVAGSLVAMVPQKVLPVFFRLFGMIGTPAQTLFNLANTVSTPENISLIGTVLVVLTFLSLLLPPHVILRTLQAGFALVLIAWGAIYYQLSGAPTQSFLVAWDKLMGDGNFLSQIIQAKTLGMNSNYGSDMVWLVGLLLGFWIFYGFIIPVFFAGEVKRPERNLITGSISALVLSWAVFVTASLLLLRMVPAEWLAAESFLAQSADFNGQAMPWIPFYAAVLQPNLVLIIIVFAGWVYSFINLAQSYFYYCSRILLSWTEDGLLPALVGFVHPGLNSPLVAVLLVAMCAEAGVIDTALHGEIFTPTAFIFFLAGSQFLPVLAVTLLPFRKREWFELVQPVCTPEDRPAAGDQPDGGHFTGLPGWTGGVDPVVPGDGRAEPIHRSVVRWDFYHRAGLVCGAEVFRLTPDQ